MSHEPDPEDAARALDDVQHRRDQAIDAQRLPFWFGVAWGTCLFLLIASPDLLPLLNLERWKGWWAVSSAVLVTAFAVAQYTPQGRSLFGIAPPLRPSGLAPPPHRSMWPSSVVTLAAVTAGATVMVLVLAQAPYWHIWAGLMAGVAVIVSPERRNARLKRFSAEANARRRS
ncbi:hypothetical protein [Streptomyces sp. NPDC047108]|uniref:hypothetical protein n=1 Tax=Streptomyces sp. NPDC047108 TaxID=3155025 RepID=UPI0034075950